MSVILVGTSGFGSIQIAEKFDNAHIVTRTVGSSILEFAQELKTAILEHPEAVIIADDLPHEVIPGMVQVREPIRNVEPFLISNTFEPLIQDTTYYREPKNTYNKYQKGRDKRNR